ncbi:type 1 fimbrial protein [Enterobacter ludwigii]|nr:type 1 fimbrial protein [Enterobacter ludwigii]
MIRKINGTSGRGFGQGGLFVSTFLTTWILGPGIVMMALSPSYAIDNWAVDGANGTLFVHGALTENACSLEMADAHQDIEMGDTGTGNLQRVGAWGEPVGFKLRLTDCLRSPASSHDVRTGGTVWADNQPAVTVSFRATRDADNPQLVKAQGVSGIGLRLLDSEGGDVRLGSRGRPLLLSPGQNTLSYTVRPERTSAMLVPGYYQATVDFRLSYE